MAHELNELRRLNVTNDLLAFKPQSKYLLGTAAATAIQADSTITAIADPNDRGGWLFKKTVEGTSKFNCYFFAPTIGESMTVGHLSSLSAVVSIDHLTNNASLPFFAIYTQPTGSGDAGYWYHSKIVGSLSVSNHISLGEKIQMYLGDYPSVNYGFRKIQCLKTITGDGGSNEPIIAISIHSDSGAALNSQILLSDVVYETKHNPNLVRTFRLN